MDVRLSRVRQGTLSFYLGGRLGADDRLLAASLSGSIVLRGEAAWRHAGELRSRGWEGELLIDPAAYELEHSLAGTPTLFGSDPWLDNQRAAQVAEYVSPGVYVPARDRNALVRGIESQTRWLEQAGSGRLSLAVHWRWLTVDLPAFTSELLGAGLPITLALADPNDPLGHAGAVKGLVKVLNEVPDVALFRADVGALGAIAHGATAGAVGTGTSVRHVVPPDRPAGGGRTGSPSVFCPELLDWRLASVLAAFPRRSVPICHLTCCQGQSLARFIGPGGTEEARRHNLHAVHDVARQILELDRTAQPVAFRNACRQALSALDRLELAVSTPQTPRPQLKAWASI